LNVPAVVELSVVEPDANVTLAIVRPADPGVFVGFTAKKSLLGPPYS
jgi:hypothetical protein